jgi:hypothetical protein
MRKLFAASAPIFLLACQGQATDPLVEECRESLTSRLKAPASYKEVEANSYRKPISYDEMLSTLVPAILGAAATQAVLDLKGKKLEEATVFIKYDAVNEYNAPIRKLEMCAFLFVDGKNYEPRDAPQKITPEAHAMVQKRNAESLRKAGSLESELEKPLAETLECCLPWSMINYYANERPKSPEEKAADAADSAAFDMALKQASNAVLEEASQPEQSASEAVEDTSDYIADGPDEGTAANESSDDANAANQAGE